MAQLYIPNLHSFAMGNQFTGSDGLFRFRIEPEIQKIGKEVDFSNSCIRAQFWHGEYCFERSTIEGEETFPLSKEGRDKLIEWIERQR